MASTSEKQKAMNDAKIELTSIKTSLTKEYIDSASLADLRGKIASIDSTASNALTTFQSINPGDLTDDATVIVEDLQQEIVLLRKDAKALISGKITELEGKEQKLEAIKDELDKLVVEQGKLTPEYFQKATIQELEAERTAVQVLHGTFLAKWMERNPSKLSESEKTTVNQQKTQATNLATVMDGQFASEISKKNIPIVVKMDSKDVTPETQINAKMSETDGLVQGLKAEKSKLTVKEIFAATKEALITRKGEFAKVYTNFEKKIAALKKLSLTASQTTTVDQQQREATEISSEVNTLFSDAIKAKESQENATKDKETAERSRDSALTQMSQLEIEIAKLRKQIKPENGLGDLGKRSVPNDGAQPSTSSGITHDKSDGEEDDPQVGQNRNDDDPIIYHFGKDGDMTKTGKHSGHHHNKRVDPKTLPNNEHSGTGTGTGTEIGTGTGSGTGNTTNRENAVMQLKLESIQLPTFSGDLTEWIAFKDLFKYLVHENGQLSNTLKFHQLRSKLRGPALDTIRGYQLTGLNYEAAWEDLQRRYDRTDELIQEYIRKFLEVPAILSKSNFTRLRAIVDATNQMMRALPSLGADVGHWDPFISLIITVKLDEETRSEWRQKIGRRTNVLVRDLIEFLEVKAIDLQPSQGDRLSQMLKGEQARKFPKRIFQVTEKKPSTALANKRNCIVCKGDHATWNCEILRKECAKVRSDMIRSFGGCFKCLLKHKVGECKKNECPYCGGPHNVLLCYKKENREKGSPENPAWKPRAEAPAWKPRTETPPRNPKIFHSAAPKDDRDDWNQPASKGKQAE